MALLHWVSDACVFPLVLRKRFATAGELQLGKLVQDGLRKLNECVGRLAARV